MAKTAQTHSRSTTQCSAPPSAALSRPELLAPAGDWECARAAVENGADAIYFGLERFNARMRARNFTETDLPALMEFLHRRGVKGYVTFNTLVFADELAAAEECLRTIISAGVDAAIVQDVGVCRLIRQLSPDFPIHASTQMSVTSAGGVEFAKELGCNLVVIARECSLKEIAEIQSSQGEEASGRGSNAQPVRSAANLKEENSNRKLPLEVFVHGALCVAYSGQCLTSEALGGRSANRGECAQACRMPYELISDGQPVPLGDKRYLLSPQDLAGLEVLPELIRAGVSSLKIEGRLKTPEYVANVTRVYRSALDKVFEEMTGLSGSADTSLRDMVGQSRYDLEMAFSRGLYTGWFRGINNQELAHATFGKKRGVFLGEVIRVLRQQVLVKLRSPLKPGDGVVFDAGHPDQEEEGGRVYSVEPNGAETLIGFGRRTVDFDRVHAGDRVWKTSDPELDRRLRQTFQGDQPHFQRPIHIAVHGSAGQCMTLVARDEAGHVVRVASEVALGKAEKQPLTTARLREQLGRLGATPFRLDELANFLEGEVILPVSEINRLRRRSVSELEHLRTRPKRWQLNHEKPALQQKPRAQGTQATPAELIVLVRNLPQLEAALDCGIQTLYCDFDNPRKYRDAVRRFREGGRSVNANISQSATPVPQPAIFVAPPRIFKTGEEWILQQVHSCEADGYLVRNYDHLKFFSGARRVGDFSLNVANGLAADYFINRFALERVTISYDLNFVQLEALLRSAPPEWFEATIHQHMPMFHMEHCVFCAFLSRGTDYTNCGRPCDQHEVKLRDRVGAEHLLKADVGCRNTVFNARAQTGADYVERMLALGLRRFRVEFVNETPEQVSQTIGKYLQLLRGEVSGGQLWRELKLLNQLGVTRGQMEKAENTSYLNR